MSDPQQLPDDGGWLWTMPGYFSVVIAVLLLVGDLLVVGQYFGWLSFEPDLVVEPCCFAYFNLILGLAGIRPKIFGEPVTTRCRRLSYVGVSLTIVHILFIAVCAYIQGSAPEVQK
ncbi:MAG: hypothetical protein ACTHN5_22645 [Phycisphaerae bacterium]